MINNLRKKFILVSMLSTFVVLFAFIFSLNVINYNRIVKDTDQIIILLSENDRMFNEGDFRDKRDNNFERDGLFAKAGNNGSRYDGMTPETPFETRFFSAVISNSGEVELNLDKVATVDSEKAIEMVESVLADGRSKGFEGYYRYGVFGDDVKTIIFVDRSAKMQDCRNTLFASVGISLCGFVMISLLVIFFSKRVFRPVEESYKKQKRFITDASHELKTPLSAILTNTEVLELSLEDNSQIKAIKNQVEKLTDLTVSLVELSRLDELEEKLATTTIQYSILVGEVAEEYMELAQGVGKKVSCNIQKGITISGDEKKIRQLLSLLLDNALKYSMPDSTIDITLKKNGRKTYLLIENDTETIKEEDMDILFERFYRSDNTRSRIPGSGIGLSVAKHIVYLHGGKIYAKKLGTNRIGFICEL